MPSMESSPAPPSTRSLPGPEVSAAPGVDERRELTRPAVVPRPADHQVVAATTVDAVPALPAHGHVLAALREDLVELHVVVAALGDHRLWRVGRHDDVALSVPSQVLASQRMVVCATAPPAPTSESDAPSTATETDLRIDLSSSSCRGGRRDIAGATRAMDPDRTLARRRVVMPAARWGG